MDSPAKVLSWAIATAVSTYVIVILGIGLLALLDPRFYRRPAVLYNHKTWIYTDKDGTGPAYTANARWQRVVASALAVINVVLALVQLVWVLRVDRQYVMLIRTWTSAAWIGSTVFPILFSLCANPKSRFNIGLAGILITVPVLVLEAYLVYSERDLSGRQSEADGVYISITQLVVALLEAVVLASVRSRPRLFFIDRPVDDRASATLLSRLSFAWAWPLLRDARAHGKLEAGDLPTLSHSMRAEALTARLVEGMGLSTKLWLPLFKDHSRLVFAQTITVALRSGFLYVPTVALNRILNILENRDRQSGEDAVSKVIPWAILMLAGAVVSVFLGAWDEWLTWASLDVALTSQLYALIFRKSLRIEDSKRPDDTVNTEEDEADEGEDEEGDGNEEDDDAYKPDRTKRNVMNLLGVDVERVSSYIAQFSQLPCAALETIFGVGFLVTVLGWKSTAIGLVVPILLYPIHRWSSIAYSAAEEKAMKVGDQKTHKVTEVLHAIKQVKFSASEDRWKAVIMAARNKELAVARAAYLIEIVMSLAWEATPILLGAVSLASYAILHGDLPASVAFTAVSVLELLEFSISILPHSVVALINARVSMRRIQQHLERTEKPDYILAGDTLKSDGVCLAWTLDAAEEKSSFRLKNLNLEFPLQKISVITGMSGAGKSLLLAGLAGEAAVLSGKMSAPFPDTDAYDGVAADTETWIIPGKKAYVAQTPWLENATITENILFGLPRNDRRYQQVIDVCALGDDINALDDGHETEVGALGINLSGGQRLRLSLARALYSRASILILDDIFSAVDVHVGRHILEKGILGGLCMKRTVIIATHHAELVTPAANYIVHVAQETARGRVVVPTMFPLSRDVTNPDNCLENATGTKIRSKPRKFVDEETRHSGAVKGEVYLRYMRAAGGSLYWTSVLILFALGSTISLVSSYIVKLWTETSGVEETNRISAGLGSSNIFYLAAFVGVSVLTTLLVVVQLYALFSGSLRASRLLFKQMTESVLQAPLRWIEKIPTGRLLNRFVADFKHVDSDLNSDIDSLLTDISRLVAIIASALVVSVWMSLPAILLLLLAVALVFVYLPGAREIKRFESIARSPILDFFGSVLSGLATIRTFDKADEYQAKMNKLIDSYASLIFTKHLATCWMNVRQGLLGAVFSGFVLGFLIKSNANASLTGFVLSFALTYSEAVSWAVWKYSELEIDMNAVERIVEYIDIPAEPDQGREPPAEWPASGTLSITNLVVAYDSQLPPVLEGISFEVLPRERIGIVGRTGSGKSTLILALFRFLEQRGGKIEIDGLDISTIPLYSLRNRLALIPQDPVLFTGTLRDNLDPFGLYADNDLLDVLRKVQRPSSRALCEGSPTDLQEIVASMGPDSGDLLSNLNHAISRGGLNVSQGQRQLICLARAMLEQPRIVLLDEATSAVDFETDTLIQRNLRERFQQSSLLVIAHRLGTVVDFDKILVMGDGRVLEFGPPRELYHSGAGYFRDMIDQSGDRDALISELGVRPRSGKQAEND